MVQIGYSLLSEEHPPRRLIDNAVQAEAAGFDFALISDHFHPWLDVQGNSPFVWSVIGALAQSTARLRIGTAVTCPIIRIHPAMIAHAAATCADMMPGRFFLGLGSGERLNEHVLGDPWPPADVRLEMLEEAVEVIHELWRGQVTDHRGDYFTVENARLYTLPAQLPPICIAASGKVAARLAGRAADGLISTAPKRELVEAFTGEGNKGPRYAQFGACWARTDEEARRTALKHWPVSSLKGTYDLDLAMPSDFQDAVSLVTEDKVAESLVCSSDARRHIARIQEFIDAGFDHISVHQVGPEQEGALRFYQEEVLPHFHEDHRQKAATTNERKHR